MGRGDTDPVFVNAHRKLINEMALRHRLPVIHATGIVAVACLNADPMPPVAAITLT